MISLPHPVLDEIKFFDVRLRYECPIVDDVCTCIDKHEMLLTVRKGDTVATLLEKAELIYSV